MTCSVGAWKVLPPYTLRNLPTRLETVRTARPAQLDLSLFKTFDLPRGLKFQVRAEAVSRLERSVLTVPNAPVSDTLGKYRDLATPMRALAAKKTIDLRVESDDIPSVLTVQ